MFTHVNTFSALQTAALRARRDRPAGEVVEAPAVPHRWRVVLEARDRDPDAGGEALGVFVAEMAQKQR